MIKIIKKFFKNLKRSTKWFFRMWNNYDWDFSCLIDTLTWKMIDMYEELRDNSHCEHPPETLKSLKVCLRLLRYIHKYEEYYGPNLDKFNDTYIRLNNLFEECGKDKKGNSLFTMPDPIYSENPETNKKIIELENKVKDIDKKLFVKREKLFFDIFKKYYSYWWD